MALLTAFVADRFIERSAEVGQIEEQEETLLAKLDAMSDRLERIERRLDRGG